ncbi:uncharacterized protein A4U43_C06F11990 [Asparagus officinalis]|uniref:Uncharacterized protein n=1 Tax=Asparagus officinalis TaxID=4686 RepID=A0A5P1ERY7_ASPOF|nr:uncharacterized protein A4U43_C06F11990 [Asparagus officinalis]
MSKSIDMKVIKADIEKRFAEQKQEREKNDEEIEIERKDVAEKEDDQDKEMEEIKDDRADMGIEVEEPVKVTEEVTEKKKGKEKEEGNR